MKQVFIISFVVAVLTLSSAMPACATSIMPDAAAATSTEPAATATSTVTATSSAATTIAITASTTISTALPLTGLPEWGTDTTRQSHMWKWSAQSIREGIADLPVAAETDLPIPVLFGATPARLSDNFGDARGSGRTHEGLDIVAAKGTPIVSPTRAVVLGAGYGPDSGYYAYTANPGGETFVYMHLDRASTLVAGNRIDPGSLIGFVGNTGNASGCSPHLHFEIRKNGATDPLPRLKREFTLTQKMSFLTAILAASSDKAGLARLLVAAYAETFKTARNSKVMLPAEIDTELDRIAAAATNGSLWNGLGIGSRGNTVVDLQNYLIGQNKGPAALKLAATGATGYFGTLTQNALNEYKASSITAVSTTPVAGGIITQAQILARIAQIKALILELQKQLTQLQTAS